MTQNSNNNNLEKMSVSSKNEKLDNTIVETLVKKLNETKDINLKMGAVDKLIKLCGSAQLKGIILDNLIKGLVNSIYEHRNDVAIFEKIMKLLEKLITVKTDKIILYLDMVIPALLEFVNHEEFVVQEVS